mmetsp:Transcript_29479/g.43283  ORF Transcript_29479/g.43283 Transcript_29479/m.43283 type:complete len:460 (-) Transcript_29479:573-1952(-)
MSRRSNNKTDEEMSIGTSLAEAPTVVINNSSFKKTVRKYDVDEHYDNDNDNDNSVSSNSVEYSQEVKKNLHERKVNETVRRALVMKRLDGATPGTSSNPGKANAKVDNADASSLYPLSVATGDAVKSQEGGQKGGHGPGGLESVYEGDGDEAIDEQKLHGLLNTSKPSLIGSPTSGRRKFWFIIAIGLASIGVIMGGLFAAGVFGTDSSSSSETGLDYISVLESISDRTLMETPDTYEYNALQWIENEDTLMLESTDELALRQRYIMALFYFALNGESWSLNMGWLLGVSECKWYGVSCNSSGQVGSIEIESNRLKGQLPTEITSLPSLYEVNVRNNQISGPISPLFADLTNLTVFVLEDNRFNSTLPVDLFFISSLKVLIVSENDLEGSIPSMIEELQELETLNLAGNSFEGDIPEEIGSLEKMISLDLQSNKLSGEIPLSLGSLNSLGEVLIESFCN